MSPLANFLWVLPLKIFFVDSRVVFPSGEEAAGFAFPGRSFALLGFLSLGSQLLELSWGFFRLVSSYPGLFTFGLCLFWDQFIREPFPF